AESACTLQVVTSPPPPDIRLHKAGTMPVPRRTSDYFIVIENAGGTTETNIEVAELLDPLDQFTEPSSTSPRPTKIMGNMLIWDITLNPGQFKLLKYRVTISANVA